MAGPYTPGNVELINTNFNKQVHNIAFSKMIMKELVLVQKSSSGVERFYKESIKELDVDAQIPRDAEFVSDQVMLDDLDIRPRKHGVESRVAWEDTVLVAPNLPERTTIRIANRVARSVNTTIWNAISEDQSASLIETIATSATWNNATRANRICHEDIAEAISLVTDSELQSYQPDTLFLSPKDFAFVRSNDFVMSSFDSSSPQLMERGVMGRLFGLTSIQNPVVTADFSLIADAKRALTWAEVSPLQTNVDPKPGKFTTFSAWEFGNAALVNPKAVCLITNTQA